MPIPDILTPHVMQRRRVAELQQCLRRLHRPVIRAPLAVGRMPVPVPVEVLRVRLQRHVLVLQRRVPRRGRVREVVEFWLGRPPAHGRLRRRRECVNAR